MAPAKKKQKAQPVRYLCNSCSSMRGSKQFPNCNPTASCKHTIHTCTLCLKKWVQIKINDAEFKPVGKDGTQLGIECPECDQTMLGSDIEEVSTQRDFKRFRQLERNNIAEKTPGWRWCLSPSCDAGQVYDPDAKIAPPRVKRYTGRGQEGFGKYGLGQTSIAGAKICQCKTCGAQACVPCDRPWHEGETCKDFQERIQHHVEDETKSLKTIGAISKRCPNCKNNIQKNGGCSNMTCACGALFCWDCLHEIGTEGIYCKCHPDA